MSKKNDIEDDDMGLNPVEITSDGQANGNNGGNGIDTSKLFLNIQSDSIDEMKSLRIINVNKEVENKEKKILHIMPCKIKYNGVANINSYFHVIPSEESSINEHEYYSTFRGRLLNGKEYQFGDQSIGYVLQLKRGRVDEVIGSKLENGDSNNLIYETKKRFRSMIVWDRNDNIEATGRIKTLRSSYQSVHNMQNIRNALHKPFNS